MPSSEPTAEQPNQSVAPGSANLSPGAPASNKMLVTVGLVVLLIAIVIGAYFAFHTSKKAVTTTTPSIKKIVPAQVAVTGSGFVPATVTIKVGQAVVWTNQDSAPHYVASDPYPTDNALAGFNAHQSMTTNGRFGFVFNKAGTYKYHDNLNPYTLRGTVVVK